MFDSSDEATITPTIINGKVNLYLSETESVDDPIFLSTDSRTITIDEPQADKNYFLIVESMHESSELSIIIH